MTNDSPGLTPRRSVALYAIVFSLFIGWASLRTALGKNPHSPSGQGLALAEIAGALLFAWQKARLAGLVILLLVFALAAALALHAAVWPGPFAFYAATALLVQYLSVKMADR